jgi:hypothetical protein
MDGDERMVVFDARTGVSRRTQPFCDEPASRSSRRLVGPSAAFGLAAINCGTPANFNAYTVRLATTTVRRLSTLPLFAADQMGRYWLSGSTREAPHQRLINRATGQIRAVAEGVDYDIDSRDPVSLPRRSALTLRASGEQGQKAGGHSLRLYDQTRHRVLVADASCRDCGPPAGTPDRLAWVDYGAIAARVYLRRRGKPLVHWDIPTLHLEEGEGYDAVTLAVTPQRLAVSVSDAASRAYRVLAVTI